MAGINNNTWYYLPISRINQYSGDAYNSYITNENLLNTSTIFTKKYNNQVLYGNSNYIPILNNNYGIICGTRVLPLIDGTFNLNIISTSSYNIDCYIAANNDSDLNVTYDSLSCTVNTQFTKNINMNGNTEYTIFLCQQNSNINSILFINTSLYNGSELGFLPINKAFTGK
jgi:hypothetical protein